MKNVRVELFLLQNKQAGFLGNSPSFVERGNNGYTQWVDQAEIFLDVEADDYIRKNGGDAKFRKIPLRLVERAAQRTVDMQDIYRLLEEEKR